MLTAVCILVVARLPLNLYVHTYNFCHCFSCLSIIIITTHTKINEVIEK